MTDRQATNKSNPISVSRHGGGRPAEALILLLFASAVLYVTWPLFRDPSRNIINGFFYYTHLWITDLLARGIMQEGKIITHTLNFNYPMGGSLTFAEWSFTLGYLVLRLFGIPVMLGLNLLIVIHLWLGCYFGYRLAFRITGVKSASMVGGIAFGLNPHIISVLSNGQIAFLSHGFIALLVLLLLDIASTDKTWPIIVFGVVFGLLTATNPYYGVYSILSALVIGFYLTYRAKPRRKKLIRRFGFGAIAAFFGVLPFLIYWSVSWKAHGLEPLFVPFNLLSSNAIRLSAQGYASLAGWFIPAEISTPGSFGTSLISPTTVIRVYYLGWCCLLLAALAFLRITLAKPQSAFLDTSLAGSSPNGDRSSSAVTLTPSFLLLTCIIFFMIAHSPGLIMSDESSYQALLPFNFPVTLPFYNTYRAVIIISLGLALLAAIGLAKVGSAVGRWGGYAVCALAGIGILAENLFLAPVVFPLPVSKITVPQVYRDLAQMPDREAVFEVPHNDVRLEYLYLFYQSNYRHPLALTHHPNYRPFPSEFLNEIFGLSRVEYDPGEKVAYLPFRYLVLHEEYIRGAKLKAVRELLDDNFDFLRAYPQDRIRLYQTRTPGSTPYDSADRPIRFYRAPHLPVATQ